jgi:ferredoxin--NADP+ reductase
MIRADESGERIPLTIADTDASAGSVTIIFQEVGRSTAILGALETGDFVTDLVGPLGVPSHLEGLKNVCVIGGGLGCAIAYPQAKALYRMGAHVDIIAGFRNESLIFLEDDMSAVSHSLSICTDDGSNGRKGLVTDILKSFLEEGRAYDTVIAIGPLIMMKFVCLTTKPYQIPTIVSLNPLMVDGTGMCGCCRVTVGGQLKFACVDGPDFDGHQVDFDEAMRRNGIYKEKEQQSMHDHICRLGELPHAQ